MHRTLLVAIVALLILTPLAAAQRPVQQPAMGPPPDGKPKDLYFVTLDDKTLALSPNATAGTSKALTLKFTRPMTPEACPTACNSQPYEAAIAYKGADFPIGFSAQVDTHIELGWSYTGTMPTVTSNLDHAVAQATFGMVAGKNEYYGPFMEAKAKGGDRTLTQPFNYAYGGGGGIGKVGGGPPPSEPPEPQNFTASQIRITFRITFNEPVYMALDRQVDFTLKAAGSSYITVYEIGAQDKTDAAKKDDASEIPGPAALLAAAAVLGALVLARGRRN